MIKAITRISPHRTALTLSVVLACCSVVFLIPMAVMLSFAPPSPGNDQPGGGFMWVLLIVFPLVYLIFGYLFIGLASLVYNGIARFTGGITIETEEST